MYIGVFKIAFAVQKHDIPDGRAVKAFCEKLMARFKVVARSNYTDKKSDLLWIAITTIADQEDTIDRLFEQILEMCDGSDLGRVYDQAGFVDLVEQLIADFSTEDHEYEP